MNQFNAMSDEELHSSAIRAARMDKEAQLVTLAHLMEVDSRRLFSKFGFSTMFSYAVSALGFSEPAAGQRVQAMRLAQTVPLAHQRLQSGEMSISSAATVQRFIRKEEKANQRVWSSDEKERIITEVSGKSARETTQTLLSFATRVEPHILREKIIPRTPSRTQLTFYVDPSVMADLERFRELEGADTLEEIFKKTLSFYLNRTDPARKTIRTSSSKLRESSTHRDRDLTSKDTSDAPMLSKSELEQSTNTSEENIPSRYVPVALHQALQARSGGRCEYVSSQTGRRCSSRFQLQVEHKIPFSCGGPTNLENCYLFCQTHNLEAAIQYFGSKKIDPFLRR